MIKNFTDPCDAKRRHVSQTEHVYKVNIIPFFILFSIMRSFPSLFFTVLVLMLGSDDNKPRAYFTFKNPSMQARSHVMFLATSWRFL